MSSARIIDEKDFDQIFSDFKAKRKTGQGQFLAIYDQVLHTVGTAHEKNKKQRQMQERELEAIRAESAQIEKQTAELIAEKLRTTEQLNLK